MFCSHCGKKIDGEVKFCPHCGSAVNAANHHNSHAHTHEGYGVASAGLRFANDILDRVFSLIFAFLFALLLYGITRNDGITGFSYFIGIIGYYLVMEGIWQRTIAKFITKTKVVMKDGSKPDFAHILGRSFARLIPFEAFSFLFTPVGWHDSLSGTLVVPASYTPEEVKKIDPKQSASSGSNTALIIIVVVFVGIVLLGLLSSVVLLSLNSARAKSRDAKRLADVRQMATALELYYNDYDRYPNQLSALTPSYVGALPTSPTPADGTCTDSSNTYAYVSNGSDYELDFCLGANTGGLAAGRHYFDPQGIDGGSQSSNGYYQ